MKHYLWLILLAGLGFAGASMADGCKPAQAPASAFGASPITTYMIVALAPDTLVGWNFEPPQQARGYLPAALFARPIIGGWFGQGKTPNLETLAALKPGISLTSGVTVSTDRSVPMLQKLGLATCNVPINSVQDFPAAFRTAGTALGVSERGEQQAQMLEGLLAAMPDYKTKMDVPRPRVYYAEGPDGLATECAGSIHAEVLALAGAENVHKCPQSAAQDRFGMTRIDFEQLVAYDPDWIVTQEATFAHKLRAGDARWNTLRAVREGRVLLAPQVPFRWLDRPPSYMRVLAMHWLVQQIWPSAANDDLDLNAATAAFFELFFQRKLSQAEVAAILKPE